MVFKIVELIHFDYVKNLQTKSAKSGKLRTKVIFQILEKAALSLEIRREGLGEGS